MNSPLISVVMSVYNEPLEYLEAAIDSILTQTVKNIEFIIINDNPENANLDYLRQMASQHKKIQLICNKKNLGLPTSLNIGVERALGKYIARMDADDISMPSRLEEQIKYLEDNCYDLVGCFIERIDQKGIYCGKGKLPIKTKTLETLLPYATIAFHPTWVVKSDILKNNLYNTLFITSQDYELLHRLVKKGFLVSNLNKALLKYRTSPNAISSKKFYTQLNLHRLVNKYTDDELLNTSVKNFLENIDPKRELKFLKCRSMILKKKIGMKIVFCMFDKNIIYFIYKSLMSFLIKKYA